MNSRRNLMQGLSEFLGLAQKAQGQPDQGFFYLGALHNAWRELSGLRDMDKILDTFLLAVMGTFGISNGYVLLKDEEFPNDLMVSRGFKEEDEDIIREKIAEILSEYHPTPPRSASLPELEASILSHPQTRLLIRWSMNRGTSGFVGLGEKILKEDYTPAEIAYLISFTEHLITHLRYADSLRILNGLRSDLGEKSDALEEALANRARIERDSDRRIFHLKIVSDAVREMTGLDDPEKIMETFLLTLMGAFGVVEGYFLLLNRDNNSGSLGHRGIGKNRIRRLSVEDRESLITRVLEAASRMHLSPMEVRTPIDKERFDHPAIPFRASHVLMFAPDRSTVGLIGLGKASGGEITLGQDRDLLHILFKNLMIFLSNAQSVRRMQKLNRELADRKVELKDTIDKLKAGNLRIELLEKARGHIRSAIRKEARRARRLSIMDFLLILGVGLAMGLAYNHSNPSGISLIPQSWSGQSSPLIDVDWAKIKYDTGASLFVDARPPELFQQKRIQGAVNLPLTLFDFVYMMKLSTIDPAKELIVYGRTVSRLYDEGVASRLVGRGHRNVKVLSGGLSTWEEKGYPVVP